MFVVRAVVTVVALTVGALGSSSALAAPVVVEVVGVESERAMMLTVESGESRVELPCRDDGEGVDLLRNDGTQTCSGETVRGPVSLSLRGGSEELNAELVLTEGDDELFLRWGADGVEILDEAPVAPEVDVVAPQPDVGPSGGSGGGGGVGFAWLPTVLGMMGAFALGRWFAVRREEPKPRGVRIAGLGAVSVERVSSEEARERLLAVGSDRVVVTAGADEALVEALKSPSMVVESDDLLDLEELLEWLAAREPLRPPVVALWRVPTDPARPQREPIEAISEASPVGATILVVESS